MSTGKKPAGLYEGAEDAAGRGDADRLLENGRLTCSEQPGKLGDPAITETVILASPCSSDQRAWVLDCPDFW